MGLNTLVSFSGTDRAISEANRLLSNIVDENSGKGVDCSAEAEVRNCVPLKASIALVCQDKVIGRIDIVGLKRTALFFS